MGRKRTGTAWEKPKGSGTWLAAITLSDRTRETEKVPPRKSGAPVDAAYAKAYAREWQRRYDEGEWTPQPKGTAALAQALTLGAWATEWASKSTHKTAEMERWVIRKMLAPDPIAAVPLRSLSTPDVIAFAARLKALPSKHGGTLAPRSVRQYLEVTHRAVAAALVAGHLAADPWERLPAGAIPASRDKTPGARRGWRYEAAEIAALIGDPRLEPLWRTLWATAFGTGARGGELCAVRWEEWERDVRPLSRLVFARTISGRGRHLAERGTKTGAVKEVPVHPALERILAWWWSEGWAAHVGRAPTPRDRIFPRATGEHLYVARLWWALQRDCKTVGIRPRRLHGTRHTTIRLAREGGADRAATRALTHTAPSGDDAFDGYDQPSWERLCEAVLKLDLRPSESDSAPDSATAVFVDPMNLGVSARPDLLINQIRNKVGVVFGSTETTTGGNALKFYATVRLDVRRIGSLKSGDEVQGNRTRVKVVKNKLAPPFREAEFDVRYGQGIDAVAELIDAGVERGVIEKSGTHMSFGGQHLGNGRERAREGLMGDAALRTRLREAIRAVALKAAEPTPMMAAANDA